MSLIIANWFKPPPQQATEEAGTSSSSSRADEGGASSSSSVHVAGWRKPRSEVPRSPSEGTRSRTRRPSDTWPAPTPTRHTPSLLHRSGEHPAETRLFSPFILQQMAASIPSRFAMSDWRLLYSTLVHGISLNTLYLRTAGCGPCIMAMRDREGVVFGAFATEFKPASLPPTFYGGGESFVFQVESLHNLPPLPQEDSPPPTEACAIYRWTAANSYFMISAKDHLAVGSGGHFALWLDAELLHGSSGPSKTFANPCLCRRPDAASALGGEMSEVGEFICDVLEVWGVDGGMIARRGEQLVREGTRL